ncbi:testis-specific serine kinase substrate isoform X3 [Sceloporus undulatus]|uniref:testis-specific serine kinase substrate isoform X3 n=1 Tax=Sceloporus undulatus TaxID=8520 RepID=UPI001C4B87CA|nr:testis-specific serine kinase substrate isoform X3 [Sceloporus undulatus]
MANFVVKTIWQSKEINEAGDTPTGAEGRPQGSKEQLGKSSSTKGFPKKKKAVSFHGVEPHLTSERNNLNLKRSSACTNVSLLNLTDGERDDSTTENESTDDGSSPGGAAGERNAPLLPIKPAWSEDDDDTSSQQQEVSNSGLLRAKDSITSLKERTSKVNRHVQSLQSECTVLCENLERRRQEAEDLEEYCTQLKLRDEEAAALTWHIGSQGRRESGQQLSTCCFQRQTESCRKVTKSVEDAEVKTNVLKKNSVLLEEKLRFLQRQIQAEDLSRQEREWLDLEQRMACGVSKQLLELVSSATATALRPSNSEEGELQQSTAAILTAINSLRVALESGHLRAGPGDEGGVDGKPNVASALACAPLLEEIRKCVLELSGQSQRDGLTQKEVLRLLAQLGVRLEGLLPQWERTHMEHSQTLRMLREELDEVSATAKRTSTSLTQLRTDLDGLRQVKPLLEDVSRHLSALKPLETPERQPASCARCSSYSFVNTESLRQMVEQAVAPILEELKQRAPPPGTCPSCQRLQKKIMDLEQSALDIHARAEAMSSSVRLAQDEALRAKNYLEQARINTEDKTSNLDYAQDKLSSLHSQLSLVSQEGVPPSPATTLAANVALTKRSSCPADLNQQPQ